MGDREDIFDNELRSLMEDAEEKVPKRVWSELAKRLEAEGLQEAKPVVIPLWARWSAVGVAVAAALLLGVFLFMRSGESSIEDALIAEAVEGEEVIQGSGIVENEGVGESETIVAQSENIDVEVVNADSENSVGASIADAAGVLASNEVSTENAADVTDSDETSESEFGVLDSGSALASNEVSDESSAETAEVSLAEQIAESSKYIAEAVDITNAAEVANAANADETAKPWTDPFAEKVSDRSSNKTRTALTVSGNAFGNASSGSSSSSTGIRRQMASSIDGQPAEGIAEKSDSNYGIPATFGVGVKIIFTPRWSLGVGVNYSLLSRTFSGDYTSYDAATDSYSTANYSNIRHRVDYIGIPVNAYFSIIQSHAVDFYAYAGGTIEKAVSSRYILDHDIPSYKESVKGVQCSTDIGIGVEFIVVDWLGIYIDPSLRYYFPNSHQPKSIRTQESLNFGFEIGLRFRL